MRLPRFITGATSPLLRNCKVRIASGPNEGLKWSLATSGRGYARGTFEAERVDAIVALMRPGDCFWDVGAHKGYVTLVAARRVGPRGHVYAFEPLRANLSLLKKHLQWNDIRNVDVMALALSDFDGRARFGGSKSSWAGRVGVGDQVVEVRSVASLVESRRCPPPTFLKIDAEGAEVRILEGARAVLTEKLVILASTHSPQHHAASAALLRNAGFRIFQSSGMGYDPDVLAVGGERELSEKDVERLRLLGSVPERG